MAVWPELVDAVRSTPEYPSLAHAMFEGAPLMVKSDEDRALAISTAVAFFDDDSFNREDRGFALISLIDLEAVEEIAVIRKQFEDNRVDVSLVGDLEEVEIALGLRQERETPKKNLREEEARLAEKEKKELVGPFPEEGSLEEKLQYFLLRYGGEDSIGRVDQLDGFLLTLCISGVRRSNLERADCIWDPLLGDAQLRPKFESKEESQVWLECVREYYQRIEAGMSDGNFVPHVSIWPDAEDSMDPEAPYFTPWLEGFTMGYLLFDFRGTGVAWGDLPLIELSAQVRGEEEAGIRLLEDRDDNPMFELMEAIQVCYGNRKARDFAPDLVSFEDSDEAFSVSPAVSAKPEVKRNDLCPCGSGRKYKKCCMN